jgi:hypothetical protein
MVLVGEVVVGELDVIIPTRNLHNLVGSNDQLPRRLNLLPCKTSVLYDNPRNVYLTRP